jgi:hypothetical protein
VDPAKKAARLRGKRAVLGLIIVVASVFVVACAVMIVPQVFGAGVRPIEPGPTEGACADGVRTLAAALDRGAAQAVTATDEASAVAAFQKGIAPDWDRSAEVEAACRSTPRGGDAFAALLRLRLAEEGNARRRGVEIGPVKRGVVAYLPGVTGR